MGEWELQVDGVWKDFDDDYGFKVKAWPGTGHSPVINRSTNYALQDGALFTGQKMGIRPFTLIGAFYGSATLAAFHDQRQALIKALSSRTTQVNQKPATIKIKYTGGTVDKEIDCIYEGGLELGEFVPFIENDVPIRFTAFNPQWNATSDAVTAFAPETLVSASKIISIGLNGDVGLSLGSGLNNDCKVLAYDVTNDLLYAGGYFTTAGGSSANYIASWDGSSWSALGSGLNAQPSSLAYDVTNDLLYVGGAFTTAGGTPVNYIASWDGSSWSALGSGLNGVPSSLAYDVTNDLLYVGGGFTTAGGASVNYIASWDGSSWSALGSGLNAQCSALAYDVTNDLLYAGGYFTTAGGSSANYIASWNGSSWATLGSGLNAQCLTLAYDVTNDLLYAGGLFSQAGGSPAKVIAVWNGTSWAALDSGLNLYPHTLAYDVTNDLLYVGGRFTTAGGISANYIASWDGSSWATLGSGFNDYVDALAYDVTNDLLYAGGEFTEFTAAGPVFINYAGTEIAYPVIAITRTGGSSASLTSLTNERTGSVIVFDYSLADGETLTFDLRPGQRSLTSSVSGSAWDAIADTSAVTSFFLQPGNTTGTTENEISFSATSGGGAVVTGTLTYRTAYRSLD